ncbi:MAG: hypothetical protein AB1589_18190 [Cyanobacteriota bacterium]
MHYVENRYKAYRVRRCDRIWLWLYRDRTHLSLTSKSNLMLAPLSLLLLLKILPDLSKLTLGRRRCQTGTKPAISV